MNKKKIFVIGLDCLTPQFLFDKYLDDMPTIKRLLEHSLWGRMKSTMPPITCPAWATMTTGKEPGELGIYGFRNRSGYAYDDLTIATSLSVKHKAIWDYAGAKDKKSIVIGPSTSEITKAVDAQGFVWKIGDIYQIDRCAIQRSSEQSHNISFK